MTNSTKRPAVSVLGRARWDRLKNILADALELTSLSERTALLRVSCADDTTLLREALKLISRETDEFEDFAQFAEARLRREESDEGGLRIGAYVVVRELGRGGMGTVYLAERADGQFQKQVAIKLLKRGTDTDEVLRRFHDERHILARLEHPNIARLLDAGTTADALPYFIMEYVDGVPITRFVQSAATDLAGRLRIFLKICSAVEHAHSQLIVHRDVKPGNILIAPDGEPKLLDFGIAKLLNNPSEAPELTSFAERRLTPIFAAPEQVAGQGSTFATDIYSLGTLLYELLTNQSPYRFTTPHPSQEEISTAIRSHNPPPPSAVAADPDKRGFRWGELDKIVQRAMEKEPAGRYSSVPVFASDIRRYLLGEPISSHSIGIKRHWRSLLRDRVRRRNLIFLAASAAIFVAVILLPVVRNRGSASRPVTGGQMPLPSIAVLPFETIGEEGGGGSYFVEGIQDNLVTDLEKIENLTVISRDGIARVTGQTKDVRDIGRLLGVGHVLQGSVQRSGQRLRVNARLIETRTDKQLWAEHYDRVVDDLFTIQAELAEKIADALNTALEPGAKAANRTRPTSDMEAYDLYLRARSVIHQFGTQESKDNYLRAAHLLEAALARDPNFVLAYCSLSEAHLGVYRHMPDGTTDRLINAKVAAEAALRLAPDLPEAHIALAGYYYRANDFEMTLSELAPAAPAGQAEFFRLKALAERRLGRWADAVKDAQKAVEIDPADPLITSALARTYLLLRRYDETERVVNRARSLMGGVAAAPLSIIEAQGHLASGRTAPARATLEAAPPDAFGRTFLLACAAGYDRNLTGAEQLLASVRSDPIATPTLILLADGMIARANGDGELARAKFGQARRDLQAILQGKPDDAWLLSQLGVAYAGLGRKEEALSTCERAIELGSKVEDPAGAPFYALALALAETWTGEKEKALEHLAALARLPGGPTFGDLHLNPIWDDLRSDPRFDAIVAEAARPL